jgi:hypothetical protein
MKSSAIFVYALLFLTFNCLLLLDTHAQTQNERSDVAPMELQVVTNGHISCPELNDLIDLADVEKVALAFSTLHLKKVYQGKCTKKIKYSARVANVEYKNTPSGAGRYACFNMSFQGQLDKKKSCALASNVKRKDELIAGRNGAYKVLTQNRNVVQAECLEGDQVTAFRDDDMWVSSGVFEDAFQEEKNSTIGAIRRDHVAKALTDACRGLSR